MRDRNHANGLGERPPASTGVLDPRILSPPLGGGDLGVWSRDPSRGPQLSPAHTGESCPSSFVGFLSELSTQVNNLLLSQPVVNHIASNEKLSSEGVLLERVEPDLTRGRLDLRNVGYEGVTPLTQSIPVGSGRKLRIERSVKGAHSFREL